MKAFIVFACLLAVAVANENAGVLRSEAEVNVDGFKYAWELDNSVNVKQEGHLEGNVWAVSGQHSYTSPEGEPVSLVYKADENGYRVVEANPPLPTSPPIPEPIQRSLDYIASQSNTLKKQ